MEPRYNPHGVEERWQQTWESEGLYNADVDASRTPYMDAHPPPNVTGQLHTGHALGLAVGDTMIRWKRMQGFNTLFQPGFDHAGISTQNVVEKALITEGTSRQELGREEFVKRVWAWLHEYGGKILDDFRRVGASLDYRRVRFTMDDGYVRAVTRWFVHLWDKGYVYRANRIINWCPHHETSLSDLELIHEDVDDTLTTIRYPLADGDGSISIATVRPATIPADVAVAVHPDDDRYKHLIGREVVVPWTERRVPVIADDRVERDFGTGALKITPGHDPTDFEIGRDHDLPEPMCIGSDGLVTAEGLEGLTQQEAEEKILAWLKERGQLEKREHYRHAVARCERCKTRIEPLISMQWWVRMDELKAPALAALRERTVVYHPESQHRYAIDSLENAPDWNVSRQIWWGHQIPAWFCRRAHHRRGVGARRMRRVRLDDARRRRTCSTRGSRRRCGRSRHSAGPTDARARVLLPGQPADDSARDHPPLGEPDDLLRPRAARRRPLHRRDIHSTVLAPDGRRMSKSLGTGIDPKSVLERYGADSTRYGMMKNSLTQDVRFSYAAIEEGGRLANKLWNAARLIVSACRGALPDERPASLEERWILARLSQTQRASSRCSPSSTSRTRRTSSTTSPSTTFATGTSRRSRAGSTTATPTHARPRLPHSSGC